MEPNIGKVTNVLKLRNILNEISQASYSFNILNRKYQIDRLSDSQLDELGRAYADIIRSVKHMVNS